MQKRYTVKNPYNKFDVGEYYSKAQIDVIYDDISDTITVSDLNNAIANFVPGDDIQTRAEDYTDEFQTEATIDSIVSDFAADWVSYTTINSRLASATSGFLIQEDMTEKMNGFLLDYISNTNILLLIDSSVTYLQEDYWHPLPDYERYVHVPEISHQLAAPNKSTVDIVLSGNTAWRITDDSPDWLKLSQYIGFETTIITATALSTNSSHGTRQHTYTGSANDVYNGSPFDITVVQLGT